MPTDYIDGFTNPNNTTYDIVSKTGRGSTAFVVTASGITSLYDGLTIVVKNIKVASASNCTLELNSLGAKRIWLSQTNAYCTTHWELNQTYIFIYDATNERWELQQGRDTDTNTFYTLRPYYINPVVGGNGVFKYGLFVRLKDGTFSSLTTSSGTGTKTFDTSLVFDISNVYYFNGSSNQAVGENLPNNTFTESTTNIDLRYSLNNVTTSVSTSSLVAKEALYMACRTTNDGYFKFSHYAQESSIRTSNLLDGMDLVYVYLGYTQDSYRLNLDVNQVPYKINPDFARNPSSTDIPIFLPYSEGEYARGYGINSHAEGNYTLASGTCSHAEGSGSPHDSKIYVGTDYPDLPNEASGNYSHTEGYMTEANGIASHAEGYGTHTTGVASHSEGQGTVASGLASHSEGYYTKATGQHQHVSGKFNVEDTNGTYAEIIGNGSSDSARSNARTLDWNGNEVIAGSFTNESKQYVVDSDSDASKVDNNVSSTKYSAVYMRDGQSRSIGKYGTNIYANGDIRTELYAQNYNTSGTSVGLNYIYLTETKSGTQGVAVSTPSGWRSALGLSNGSVTNNLGWTCYSGQQYCTAPTSVVTSLSNNTNTHICTLTLPTGLYVIIYMIRFASNSSGRRYMSINSTNEEGSMGIINQVNSVAVNGDYTYMQLTSFINATSETTIYFRAYQNSGVALGIAPRYNVLKIY